MIKPINASAIPQIREIKHSAARIFADEAVAEFLRGEAEAAEITDLPEGTKPQQVAQLLRNAVWRCGRKGTVKVIQRKGRIFITKPPHTKKVIKMPQANPRRQREEQA